MAVFCLIITPVIFGAFFFGLIKLFLAPGLDPVVLRVGVLCFVAAGAFGGYQMYRQYYPRGKSNR